MQRLAFKVAAMAELGVPSGAVSETELKRIMHVRALRVYWREVLRKKVAECKGGGNQLLKWVMFMEANWSIAQREVMPGGKKRRQVQDELRKRNSEVLSKALEREEHEH